ncbi:hypothetical protein KXD40_003580 [Peronospora effusa]|uniref:Uncharacterized protein n=1 Tax=Peronospora effusa TaxID=542832 RepID=A0A3M6VCU5_9STRA|nr:hypothetical protein DD238_005497 [Peronospora effusa]RQM09674.1 hypothetical protein DD237_005569 [Peronospora effusa]UIZ22729.1 hypothetical protein KXD40_003580 [Peronospora effusa]CAI5729523.1 unnamed protein product [Peronospora effusa]
MTTPSVLRQLFSFNDETVICSSVSIEGYGTYCVKQEGPVCGATQGNCPIKGASATKDCTTTSQTYLTGCTAPVNAQCVLRGTNNWVCVFKEDPNADGAKSEEVAQVESLSTSPDQSLQASTQSPGGSMLSGVGISLNVAVVVACCVLAFVGLVLVKKRRNRQRSDSYTLSERDISIVTL